MNKSIEISVFVSGAVIMIFELAGARMVGPYFGTSMYVWTSIIGIILTSLSLGYWYGGKRADLKGSKKEFATILLFAALALGIVFSAKNFVLTLSSKITTDIRLGAIISGIALFSFPSFLFGMVSPYAIRLLLTDIKNSGAKVGGLYALSTIGSIIGTFLGGFYLVPFWGFEAVIVLCSFLMLFTSVLVYYTDFKNIAVVFIISIAMPIYFIYKNSDNKTYDTPYSHIMVYDDIDKKTKERIKVLRIDNHFSSAIFYNSDELVLDVLKYFRFDSHLNPGFKKTLMLGGAACSYPRELIKKYDDVQVDIVEIDKKLIEIASQEFGLQKNDRLHFYYEDGRTFLNRNEKKYDIIYVDAFNALFSAPYQLVSKEAIEKIYDGLTPKGAAIVNIISPIAKSNNLLLRAEYATYKAVFPHVYLFTVDTTKDSHISQNVCLIASKKQISFKSDNKEITRFLEQYIDTD